MDFNKKFSIGLPVLDPVETFDAFLDKYTPYIYNVYFSLPLGDRYHSRVVTKQVLADPSKKTYFLELLRCVQKHGIRLELLFNTHGLTQDDLVRGKHFLDNNGIDPEEIGFLDSYYDIVSRLYPDKEYVYSFNNFPQTESDYWKSGHMYGQYVMGRKFIRNTSLFQQVKDKGARVVLLLNNGCSFTCGGCKSSNHCHDAYYMERLHYDKSYMYALQSIMPYELHEELLDTSAVDYFKIASRNADVSYIAQCMDSYIHNRNEECIDQNKGNYLLWSRLSWHCKYFRRFEFDRIRAIKKDIYENPQYFRKYRQNNPLRIALDLSAYPAITGRIPLCDAIMQAVITDMEQEIGRFAAGNARLEHVFVGVQSCEQWLTYINPHIIAANITYLKSKGYATTLVFPRQSERLNSLVRKLMDVLYGSNATPNYVMVNDEWMLHFMRETYNIPVALGRDLALDELLVAYDPKLYAEDVSKKEVARHSSTTAWLREYGIAFAYCDTSEDGLHIPSDVTLPLYVNVSEIVIASNILCAKKVAGMCDGSCVEDVVNTNKSDTRRCGDSLYMRISRNLDINSSVLENAYTSVYTPREAVLRGEGEV